MKFHEISMKIDHIWLCQFEISFFFHPHSFRKAAVSPSSEGVGWPYGTLVYHQSVILGTGTVFITVGVSPNNSERFLGLGLFFSLYWWLSLWYLYEVQKPSVQDRGGHFKFTGGTQKVFEVEGVLTEYFTKIIWLLLLDFCFCSDVQITGSNRKFSWLGRS